MAAIGLLGASVLALLVLVTAADAKIRTVHNTRDSGRGSLRQTVRAAHASDIVVVPKGTYKLRSGEIMLKRDIDLRGAGPGRTKISGKGKSRIFEVRTGSKARISELKLTDGKAPTGGAILNAGDLTLEHASLTGNRAVGGEYPAGGAIKNSGKLNVSASTLRGNHAEGDGGAISAGSLDADPTQSGPVRISHSKLIGNRAELGGKGGAIAFEPHVFANGGLFVSSSTIAGNRSTGAPPGGETSAGGGGIHFAPIDNDGFRTPLEIRGSTISGNLASATPNENSSFGGGLYFGPLLHESADSSMKVVNSTISGNQARNDDALGGGVFVGAIITDDAVSKKTFTDVTLARNEAAGGGGIYAAASSPIYFPLPRFTASIIALNASDNPAVDDCSIGMNSGGHNLEGSGGCLFTNTGDMQTDNPRLRPLADNGGPTKTMALKPSSPAVNGATKTGCPKTDQRAVRRPQGARCDIGAYELKR